MRNDVVDVHIQNKQFGHLPNRYYRCSEDDIQSYRDTNAFSDWFSISITILLTNYAFKWRRKNNQCPYQYDFAQITKQKQCSFNLVSLSI